MRKPARCPIEQQLARDRTGLNLIQLPLNVEVEDLQPSLVRLREGTWVVVQSHGDDSAIVFLPTRGHNVPLRRQLLVQQAEPWRLVPAWTGGEH